MTPGWRQVAVLLAGLLVCVAGWTGEPRVLVASMPVEQGAVVDIEASLGSVELDGLPGLEIQVEVRLAPRAGAGVPEQAARVTDAIAAAKLIGAVDGNSVRFHVAYPTEVLYGAVEEYWRVRVPPDVGARVQMAAGDLRVAGVAGGVDIQLGIGRIDIDVPRGDLRANLSVGDILATTGSTRTGRVVLTSHVGQVQMRRGGKPVEAAPMTGPGSSLSLTGEGSEWLILSSDVGDVRLEIDESGQYSLRP